MPTYEYECAECGLKFERRQAITEAPLTECPACGGGVRRLISGGTGFILKGAGHGRAGQGGAWGASCATPQRQPRAPFVDKVDTAMDDARGGGNVASGPREDFVQVEGGADSARHL